MNVERIASEAAGIVGFEDPDTMRYRMAAFILQVLEQGYAPAGYALVKQPELLGKGVPQR